MNKTLPILLILAFFVVGCSDLEQKKVYEDDLIDSLNLKSSIETKYFDGNLNYIFTVSKLDKCNENLEKQISKFSLIFSDKDGFKVMQYDILTSKMISFLVNDCKYQIKGHIPMDQELYRLIDDAYFLVTTN